MHQVQSHSFSFLHWVLEQEGSDAVRCGGLEEHFQSEGKVLHHLLACAGATVPSCLMHWSSGACFCRVRGFQDQGAAQGWEIPTGGGGRLRSLHGHHEQRMPQPATPLFHSLLLQPAELN